MPLSASCPRCTHKSTYDDALANKTVHCKICHHAYPLKGAKQVEARSSDQVKEGRPAPAKSSPDKERKPARREERDDEVRERGPRRPKDTSSSAVPWVLAGMGTLLLLGGCCVGMPALYFFLGPNADPPPPAADVAVAAPPAVHNPVPVVVPAPDFRPPPPVIDPFVPVPPAPVGRFGPKNPAEIDKVLPALQDQGPEFQAALGWLRDADATHPRRADVVKALEERVDEQLRQPFGNDAFFRPYFRWVTKDNLPTLRKLAANKAFTVWDNQRRQQSIEALGRFKDDQSAEILAERLTNPFDRDVARRALAEIGPAAQPAVLKYFNHPDRPGRDAARDLLRQYQTKPEAIVPQIVADLSSENGQTRDAAIEWLSQTPAIAEHRPAVARALDPLIGEQKVQFNRQLPKALENWAGPENVEKLTQVLAQSRLGRKDIVQLLGKLRAPEALPALANRLGNFFDGRDAHEALKQYGKDAEPAVVPLLASTDRKARLAAVQLLEEIGTAPVSVPALQRAAQQHPQDRQFVQAATRAAQVISTRKS